MNTFQITEEEISIICKTSVLECEQKVISIRKHVCDIILTDIVHHMEYGLVTLSTFKARREVKCARTHASGQTATLHDRSRKVMDRKSMTRLNKHWWGVFCIKFPFMWKNSGDETVNITAVETGLDLKPYEAGESINRNMTNENQQYVLS